MANASRTTPPGPGKPAIGTPAAFYAHLARNIVVAFVILGICLLIGVLGYHYSDDIPWIDALHNAAMILSGMGPVVPIQSTAGKLFSTFYALFSGVVFITNIGLLLAPAAHRIFHRFHLDEDAS